MTASVDVLAVAAHPDDAEVGCGGTLILATRSGLRAAVADLTMGERSTRGDPDRRARERDLASERLGLSERVGLGLPDTRLGTEPGHREALIGVIRDLRPRIVLAPHVEDRHPDHAAAGRLAVEASFLAGVGKAGAGPPHRPRRVYHYMLHHPFDPSFVVDVSAVWDRRTAAVAAYESQFGAMEPATALGGGRFLELLAARATFYGAMVGAERGEAFLCHGPIAVAGLPEADRPVDGTAPYRSFP